MTYLVNEQNTRDQLDKSPWSMYLLTTLLISAFGLSVFSVILAL
jgi:hypothetical protein